MRKRKRQILSTVVVAACVFAGIYGYRWGHEFARTQVLSQLEELNGGPVQFDHVSLSLRSLTIHDVVLFEPQNPEAVAWCTVDRIWMNIPLWDGLRGKTTAERAILYDPAVKLRFSADGRLLNRFRSATAGIEPPAHRMEIRNGSLTIEQLERSVTVRDVSGTVQQIANDLRVQGSAGELLNANWEFDGTVNSRNLGLVGKASTDSMRVTPATLKSLPVVGFDVATHVDFAAEGPAQVTVNWNGSDLDYEGIFTLTDLQATLPTYGVTTSATSGTVAIKNETLMLSEVRGDLFGGHYTVSGNIAAADRRGNANLEFRGIDSRGLPTSWKVPPEVMALLDGKGQVSFETREESWSARGAAEAEARDVSVFGLQLEPMPLSLEFNTPTNDPSELPFGVEGTARVQLAVNDGRTETLRRAMEQVQSKKGEWLPSQGQDAVALSAVTQRLKELDGDFSFAGSFAIPLATARRLESISGEGNLTSSSLSLERFGLRDSATRVELKQGKLSLSKAKAQIVDSNGQAAGHFDGTATMQIFPLGEMRVSADLGDVPLSLAASVTGMQLPELPTGDIHTSLTASVPLQQVNDVSAWMAQGELSSPSMQVDTYVANQLSTLYQVSDSVLELSKGHVHWRDNRISFHGSAKLKSPYPFEVQGDVTEVNLAAMTQEIPQLPEQTKIAGKASITGNIKGDLSPFTWRGTGTGALLSLAVEGLDLGDARFSWQLDSLAARVTDLNARLFGGTATAEATYGFDNQKAIHSLKATLVDFDPTSFASAFKTFPQDLTGRISADVELRDWDQLQDASGEIRFRARELRVANTPVGRFEGDIQLADQVLTLDAGAAILGGQVQLTGSSSVSVLANAFTPSSPDKKPPDPNLFVGRVTLQRLPIERLLRAAKKDRALKPLSGLIEANLNVHLDRDMNPHADGQLVLRNVRWLRQQLSRQLEGQLIVADKSIRLEKLAGDFAGGYLRAHGDLTLGRKLDGRFQVDLERVKAAIALAPIPALADNIEGPMNIRIYGTAGDQWAGRGSISMSTGKALQFPISQLRAPLSWSFSPLRPQLKLQSDNVVAGIGRGQVTGRLDVDWGNRLSMAADLQARNVQLNALLRDVPGIQTVGAGRIGGKLRLAGRSIETMNDLTGRFEADLSRLQPLQFPVLRQMNRFLGSIQPSTYFNSGARTGRLANGIIHVDQTTIDGGVAKIVLEGKATLRGQLDFDVTAKTGDVNDLPAGLSRLVRSPIVVAAPTPLALLRQANEFLSDRLIFLHIGGSVKRPVVRPQPARQLQQETIRFLLQQATAVAAGN